MYDRTGNQVAQCRSLNQYSRNSGLILGMNRFPDRAAFCLLTTSTPPAMWQVGTGETFPGQFLETLNEKVARLSKNIEFVTNSVYYGYVWIIPYIMERF